MSLPIACDDLRWPVIYALRAASVVAMLLKSLPLSFRNSFFFCSFMHRLKAAFTSALKTIKSSSETAQFSEVFTTKTFTVLYYALVENFITNNSKFVSCGTIVD